MSTNQRDDGQMWSPHIPHDSGARIVDITTEVSPLCIWYPFLQGQGGDMTTHADMVIYADLVVRNLTAEIEGQPQDSHHDRLRYARSRAEQVRDYLVALEAERSDNARAIAPEPKRRRTMRELVRDLEETVRELGVHASWDGESDRMGQ